MDDPRRQALKQLQEGRHAWASMRRFGDAFATWECCQICGVVRREDGKNNPCKGPVRVGPRATPQPGKGEG